MNVVERKLISPTRTLRGKCLHRGGRAGVRILPARSGAGVRFRRRGWPAGQHIQARLSNVDPVPRRTGLRRGSLSVDTVEHLMSALGSLGLYDAEILLDGPEVPILDGSAAPFVRPLIEASTAAGSQRRGWIVDRDFMRRDGLSVCQLSPRDHTQIECHIDFDHPRIGRQFLRYEPGDVEGFLHRIAPARTFGFHGQVSQLRRAGLARGADLSSVLVLGSREVLNPGGARFKDEPVRHKVLDALGDLALLGAPLCGRLKLRRCSHRLLLATLIAAAAAGALRRGGG